jgi:hypothetical protein
MHEIVMVPIIFGRFINGKKLSTPERPVIIHRLRGRIRLKYSRWKNNGQHIKGKLNPEGHIQVAMDALSKHGGIFEISANAWTGTLLIHFDEKQIQPKEILKVLENAVYPRGK